MLAASVAIIQLYVGSRQADAAKVVARAAMMNAQSAGRHTVAEFRQTWTNNVGEERGDRQRLSLSPRQSAAAGTWRENMCPEKC